MEAGGTGELIGLNIKGEDAKSVLVPIQYNQIDPALYDTATIRAELELIWGIQEALASSIRTAKTLGEAEIQEKGTEARQDYKRDSLEEMLGDLAYTSAEIVLQQLPDDEVREIAGPEAFWPATADQKLTLEDLRTLVQVEIRAGSTGKPNTRLRQETWNATAPVLKQAIEYLAQLRQSSPLDVANCIEQIVIETLERSGERLDPNRFLPKQGNPVQLLDPVTMQPVLAWPMPQQATPGAVAPPAPGAPAPGPASPPATQPEPATQPMEG